VNGLNRDIKAPIFIAQDKFPTKTGFHLLHLALVAGISCSQFKAYFIVQARDYQH
jgi:hypothetical protein